MTRDDIIRMAREAGCEIRNGHAYMPHSLDQMLKRFATLVAAAEREACAHVCETMRPSKPEFDQRYWQGCTDSATAIRARGET